MFSTFIFLFVLKQCSTYLLLPNSSSKVRAVNLEIPLKVANYGRQPNYFDWREKNKVSPIKNQGNCKACWAFSIVANIESHLSIHKNIEMILSEQFLIDCDDDQKGCESGSLLQSFANVITKFGGVLPDKDYYPYESRKDVCRWHKPPPKPVPVIGFRRVPPDEEVMAQYIWKHGPLSAGINSKSMSKYKKGNWIDEPSDWNCNPEERDHAVLIVGYDFYKSPDGKETPYWIIKNSWGSDWGDGGFYYLVRGRNACGIASDVSISFVT